MKYLFSAILILLLACNNHPKKQEQSMEEFSREMRRDSSDLVQVNKQINWRTEMKILLYRRGIKGKAADKYVDSIENETFQGLYPGWYKKYRKAINDSIN